MIPEANRRIGSVSSHDISVPLGAIPEFIDEARQQVAADRRIPDQLLWPCRRRQPALQRLPRARPHPRRPREPTRRDQALVHDLVTAMGGSVSAEHGIGRLKVDDLERYGDPAKLAAMRAIKAALDPVGHHEPRRGAAELSAGHVGRFRAIPANRGLMQ